MKEIALTGEKSKGLFTIVDDDDYQIFKDRFINVKRYRRELMYARIYHQGKMHNFHRLIINAKPGEIVDHINHNGLDNRKENLRIVTHQMNILNSRKNPKTSSKYKGVSWDSDRNKWSVKIMFNYKTINLGRFDCEDKAAKAYLLARKNLGITV